MSFEWDSDQTIVLMNPRMPGKDKYTHRLHEIGLKGHIWLATSGTTSIKWVALSKKAILHSARAVSQHLEMTDQDIWINPLPDFHIGGLAIWARTFVCNAKVVDFKRESKWHPKVFRDCLASSKGTLTSLVPAQLYDLVCLQLEAPPSLRAVLIGGGRLEYSLYSKAVNLGWRCLPTYGMTETASQVATAKPETKADLELLPHVSAKINDEGLICIKSDCLLTCYAEINSETVVTDPKNDGWFCTDDVGVIKDNSLKVKGRKSDFIKIGGESVSVTMLESVFDTLKLEYGVTDDMALVAIPDDRLGHVIHLATTYESLRLLTLVEEFQERVHPFERIRQIHRVDKIPRGPMNKVIKSDLEKVLTKEPLAKFQ
jgi:o-succinylbenzoate---CoA ligase